MNIKHANIGTITKLFKDHIYYLKVKSYINIIYTIIFFSKGIKNKK